MVVVLASENALRCLWLAVGGALRRHAYGAVGSQAQMSSEERESRGSDVAVGQQDLQVSLVRRNNNFLLAARKALATTSSTPLVLAP